MQKSIKKVIAGAIAALMITSSMPFAASAAVGDYEPDIQLQFSTFCDDPSDPTATTASNLTGYQASGLAGFPIQWDQKNGTLYAKKEDINTYNLFYDEKAELATEDWVLEEGNLFALTVRLDNISTAALGNIYFKFSDNIAPAGLWQQGTGKKAKYGYASEDDAPSKLDGAVGFRSPVKAWSATDLYTDEEGKQVFNTAMEQSEIEADPNAVEGDEWSDLRIRANFVCDGDTVDVSSIGADNGFFNIVDGTFDDENGYTYDNKFIVATYVFAITDDTKPIQFALADPDGTIIPKLDGAVFYAKKSEGLQPEFGTTYAVNRYNSATKTNDGDTVWPGSEKMTFMGPDPGPGPVPYTIVFLNEDGTQISSTEYEPGAEVTIPSLPQSTYDKDNHYTFAWNSTPSATAIADATYQVVKTTTAHTYGEGVVNPQPTCTSEGLITYTCTGCDWSYSEKVNPTAHSLTKVDEVPATCTTTGTKAYWTCSSCHKMFSDAEGKTEITEPETINVIPHSLTKTDEVPATCTTTGTKAYWTCSSCHKMFSDAESKTEITEPETIDVIAHSLTKTDEVPATCTTTGTKAYWTCASCHKMFSDAEGKTEITEPETINVIPHSLTKVDEVPATKMDDGTEAYWTCTSCHKMFSDAEGKNEISTPVVIPATGVVVKVAKTDIGKVEGDLVTGDNKLAYGASYTVTAVPVEGATFVGWEIDGNIISREATYTATAYSNITITPVFEDAAADTITVTFYDKYGNTVKQYKDLSVADYQTQIAADYDDLKGPAYPSYVFAGWDKDKDEILALSASTTIWANYEKVEEEEIKKYTVNTNATLILPDGIVNGQIPYDTQVTVKDDNATAWRIGEATVAYGTEYTFYVGSDVVVSPVYEAVEEKATTTIIGASLVGDSDFKYNIVATRNIPDGYEVIDYGFVYGKNLTNEDLDLDKVGQNGSNANSGAVKAVHAGARNLNTNEFALNYGITAKNAPITAKSFVTVVKGDKTEIVYSDMFTQNY